MTRGVAGGRAAALLIKARDAVYMPTWLVVDEEAAALRAIANGLTTVIPPPAALEALRSGDAARCRWLLNRGTKQDWIECGHMNAYDDVEAYIDAANKESDQ